MKIAILDADPRICGPMSWSQHLASGFQELGHDTVVVSSTKSGRARSSWGTEKWGNHWSVFTPGLTVKDTELASALDGFDLVVLPEPKVPAADKEALKNETIPTYVTALMQTKTPFIFALHGNNYDDASAPFMKPLMISDNWCGTVISHSKRSTSSAPVFADLDVVHSALPYRPTRDVEAVRQYTKTVGTTGRFIFNKGPHLVALAAPRLANLDAVIELWGSASAGLGASHTYSTYEEMLPFAEKYQRYGDQDAKRGQPGWTEHGNIIRPYHWDIRTSAGPLVRYLGNYSDPVGVTERLSVHVNLTGYKFSGDLVEYSTLEAMDGGALCIVPPHCNNEAFRLNVVAGWTDPAGSPKSALKNDEQLKTVADKIDETLYFAIDHPSGRDEVVRHNREAVRVYNNPASVAQTFLEGAFK